MKLAMLALALFAAPTFAQKAPMTRTVNLPAPPVAKTVPHSFERHGVRVEDPYNWLKDQGYPKIDDADVLGYLKAENGYFEAAMKPHEPLVDTLFAEMKGRIKEDDASVPAPDGFATMSEVFGRVSALGVDLHDISLRKPSLDEVFFTLTGAPAVTS